MILVVSANNNQCRIYRYQKKANELILEKEISHPEAKLHNRDIVSDKPGHYKAGSGRGSYSPSTEPKEVEIEFFSREIARELNQQRNNHEYERLILIASKEMTGLLNLHCDKHVIAKISQSFNKDLLHLKDHELLHFLNENTPFPKP